MTCIATCYFHLGAIRFQKLCSISCGTCVCYEADVLPSEAEIPGEVEQIVALEQGSYRTLCRAGNS